MRPQRASVERSAWSFVPVLYFLQGVPSAVVRELSTAYFTQIGVGLVELGRWPSLLILPWTVKPLWGPFVDTRSTKRTWILATQAAVFAALLGAAFAAGGASALDATRTGTIAPLGQAAYDVLGWSALDWMLVALACVALASATHDIAADGFYILALDAQRQAAFVGVRTLFFRLALLVCGGLLLKHAGDLQRAGLDVATAWQRTFFVCAALYGACAVWNAFALPRPALDRASGRAGIGEPRPPFASVLASYFRQPRIVAILAFILLYRLGESMISAFSTPFLMKPPSEGGLGVSASAVGELKGTFGLAALTLGGIAGGVVIARYGIKRCFWPMVLAMNVPNLFYVWAALEPPGYWTLGGLIAVDQFGYGFGFAAYMVYLMFLARGQRFATAHYAISTGLMALSAQAAGFFSGNVVAAVGFPWFFAIVCVASVPGMLTLFFIPMEGDDVREVGADAA